MPDIKALITLKNKEYIYSGFRPSHMIGDYLTTGLHEYIEVDRLLKNKPTEGYITFISPEIYPNKLEIGMIINFYEGATCLGDCRVLEIYNEILKKWDYFDNTG